MYVRTFEGTIGRHFTEYINFIMVMRGCEAAYNQIKIFSNAFYVYIKPIIT